MSAKTKIASTTTAFALALIGAPTAHAGGGTSCVDWGNFTACRTTSYDISTSEGYTIDCYYYQDGSSECR